jgi:hypothetical protein
MPTEVKYPSLSFDNVDWELILDAVIYYTDNNAEEDGSVDYIIKQLKSVSGET